MVEINSDSVGRGQRKEIRKSKIQNLYPFLSITHSFMISSKFSCHEKSSAGKKPADPQVPVD
jgi:hypothetical protein